MKRAIVTGGTGCVGRNLIDVLEKDNWEIIVLHRKSSDLSKLEGCKVNTVEVDFEDKNSLLRAIPFKANAIFHVAANLSHEPGADKQQWLDNVQATGYLAEVAITQKVERFIFTSTGATIPYHTKGEEACHSIKNTYVRTKRLAELELYKFINQNLDYVILHPIIVIGKYDYNNYSTIFKLLKDSFFKRAFDGNFTFCDAEQIAKAHLSAYYRGKKCEHYLLGGVYSSWVELSNTAAKILKLNTKVKPIPYPLLKIISYFAYFYATLFRKKQHLTPQVADLVGRGEPQFNLYLQNKSKSDLGYNPEGQSIEKMVGSCINWMQVSGKI
jgi:dihydroflavonol-4-reductase